MNDQQKDSKWELDAPKFWDLSETLRQDRPTEAWFCLKNISAASFGAPKKRRALRQFSGFNLYAKKPSKPIQQNVTHHSQEQLNHESVFDRLSRESTISFSRKTGQSLTPQQRQHHTHHPEQQKQQQHQQRQQEEPQHQLNVESSKETVGERVARLEGSNLDHGKMLGLGKNNVQLKKSSSHSTSRTSQGESSQKASQPQTLYEEMQRSQQAQQQSQPQETPILHETYEPQRQQEQQAMDDYTIESTIDLSSPTRRFMLSPARTNMLNVPMTPQLTISPRSPMSVHSASPIRKAPANNQREKKIKEEKTKDIVQKFFNGLLEKKKSRNSSMVIRVTEFFDNLLKKGELRNKKRKRSESMEDIQPSEQRSTLVKPSIRQSFVYPLPRKRTMSTVGARFAVENIKKARFELKKSKERTQKLLEDGSDNSSRNFSVTYNKPLDRDNQTM